MSMISTKLGKKKMGGRMNVYKIIRKTHTEEIGEKWIGKSLTVSGMAEVKYYLEKRAYSPLLLRKEGFGWQDVPAA